MNPLTWLQQRITKPTPDAYSHISPINTQANQLLKQSMSGDSLDDALTWLQNTAKADSDNDNSDVWHYSKHWQQHKADLQQRILNGTFRFQTVRDVAIKNDAGKTEHREIRCAEDRLLIRAISQTLSPIFEQSIAPECTQLSGRGGTKKPVEDSHAQLLKQPKAHVMKSDVKGYYAHIDHFILHTQFCTLLPQEIELQRLLWLFLQRTVERGGNYRDIEIGIPLGASLSPQLGALYLSPLDALFSQDDKHFYRRYMDDWVIFCKNRYDLRDTVKQVYAVLHTLRVEVAPNKTYIGKASKGFDFLGKRIHPNGILPSAAALSRMQKNTIRLYEQGASKKRIGLVWMRWLCWALPIGVPMVAMGDVRVFGTNSVLCLVELAGDPVGDTRFVGSWVVRAAPASGAILDTAFRRATQCLSASDSACVATAPIAALSTGDTVYAKSTTEDTFWKCPVTLGSLLVAESHSPTTAEPSNQPTSAVATSITASSIASTWTDSIGASAPSNYLVQCDTDNGFANSAAPVDGTAQSDDTSCADGSGVQNIAHGAGGSATWSSLDSGTQYFYRIFAYSNAGSDIDYLLPSPATTDGTTLTATPTNHPTNLSAAASSSSAIDTTWTDASVGDLPSHYLLLCATSNSFTNPVDGTAQTDDSDCSDGTGIQNIAQGTQAAAWSGLNASTQYFFKIFPSAGSGAAIVYKTDGTAETADATTNAAATGGNDDDTTAEEPTEHPTGSGATGNSDDSRIQVTWTDTDESPNYAVFCNTSGTFTDPVDGVAQTTDASCADGSGVQTLEQNSAASQSQQASAATGQAKASRKNASLSTTWSGLNSGTTYFFKIFPYFGSDATINYKVNGNPSTVNTSTSGSSTPTSQGAFGGEKVTPSIYTVTVSKVEFKNAQGEFVTLAEEGTSFDVASVGANRSVGTFGKTAILPNGSYSQIRVTLASNFGISASGSDKGSACRTDSGGSTGSVSSSLSNVSIGSSDGGTATLQQVGYPSGSTASSALSSASITESGGDLQITAPASFTVTDNSIPPSIAINIDVTNAVEVLTSGGNCHVLPQPPSVHVSVGG